jgi:hypothetical protein
MNDQTAMELVAAARGIVLSLDNLYDEMQSISARLKGIEQAIDAIPPPSGVGDIAAAIDRLTDEIEIKLP